MYIAWSMNGSQRSVKSSSCVGECSGFISSLVLCIQNMGTLEKAGRVQPFTFFENLSNDFQSHSAVYLGYIENQTKHLEDDDPTVNGSDLYFWRKKVRR